MMTKLRVSVYG